MRARNFIQTVRHFRSVETATQHLRREQAHATADWTSCKHFLDHLSVVVNGNVEILTIERNLPGGAAQLAWTFDPDRGHRRHFDRLRVFARNRFLTS